MLDIISFLFPFIIIFLYKKKLAICKSKHPSLHFRSLMWSLMSSCDCFHIELFIFLCVFLDQIQWICCKTYWGDGRYYIGSWDRRFPWLTSRVLVLHNWSTTRSTSSRGSLVSSWLYPCHHFLNCLLRAFQSRALHNAKSDHSEAEMYLLSEKTVMLYFGMFEFLPFDWIYLACSSH